MANFVGRLEILRGHANGTERRPFNAYVPEAQLALQEEPDLHQSHSHPLCSSYYAQLRGNTEAAPQKWGAG